MNFELWRGNEDSADATELNFDIILISMHDDELDLTVKFENPEKVSIGLKKDILTVSITN